MAVWIIGTQEPYFSEIGSGEKTWEGCVPNPARRNMDYRQIMAGDALNFRKVAGDFEPVFPRQLTQCEVSAQEIFKSVDEGLYWIEKKGLLHQLLPGLKCVSEGIKLYHNGFPGNKERVERFGFVLVNFTKIP